MRRSVVLSIAATALLTATCVAGRQHDERIFANAARVRPGMKSEEVVRILGDPSWRDKCEAKFPYGPPSPRCAAELGYRSALAPLVPEYVVVQLNRQDQVISADIIQSP